MVHTWAYIVQHMVEPGVILGNSVQCPGIIWPVAVLALDLKDQNGSMIFSPAAKDQRGSMEI